MARYALRGIEKIVQVYSQQHYEQHIKASLDKFFAEHTEEQLQELLESTNEYFGKNKYPMWRLKDVADPSQFGMLAVCVTHRAYDVWHIAFLGFAW